MRHLLLVLSALSVLALIPDRASTGALTVRAFDADRAYADLMRQCKFGPRVPGTEAHARCARWLTHQLRACADSVALQSFTPKARGKPLPLTNIVSTFNPDGRRHILFCAHWDSRPAADCDPTLANRSKPVPGANDGASGVAVLLEIARALKASPPQQRVTIALFDGEDYGPSREDMYLGSREFAERYSEPLPAWAVLLDMVGDRDLRITQERFSLQKAPEVVDRIWGAAARAGCDAFVRQPGPAVLDDHVFLLQKGIPCVDVIDFDYPYWHTLEDTPDKCSPESLEQVGRALLRAIAEDKDDQS